jgi:hypothetical protein
VTRIAHGIFLLLRGKGAFSSDDEDAEVAAIRKELP